MNVEHNNVIEKHKTGIYGLDQLFFGGIQLRLANGVADHVKTEGMIIVIKGHRVCYKTMLAMHLMHGLTKSLKLRNSDFFKSDVPKFYSLDEPEEELYDQYIDLLITRQIEKMIRETISGKTEDDDSQATPTPIGNLWENNRLARAFFRVDDGEEFMDAPTSPKLPNNFRNKLDVLMFERAVYYSCRTNALHFKVSDTDSHHNLLYFRRSNQIGEYLDEPSFKCLPERFKNDFVNAIFIGREGKKKESGYPKTSTIRLQSIIDSVEKDRQGDSSSSYLTPCIVIDGLSDIADQNLRSLPFTHISNVLRQVAPVSILVFDDRYDSVNLDADIVIEMRNDDNNSEEYSFNELRIAKSTFQSVAYGWHLYKRRDTGIEIFPSLHRILQRREYLNRVSTYTHRGVFDESYSEYIERLGDTAPQYDDFRDQRSYNKMLQLRKMYSHEGEWVLRSEAEDRKIKIGYLNDTLLSGIDTEKGVMEPSSYITAVIGNPNSFKRHMAMVKTFALSLKEEHSLVLLFDKDSTSMKRMMRCSGYQADKGLNIATCRESCCECSVSCSFIKNCMHCYEYIHFMSLRMGCITAEEILFVLEQQIDLSFKDGKHIKHIFIEDLQKIDYSFPFLKINRLFLSALVTFCRDKKVDLTILCDKNAALTRELCTLADNVVCMERDIADVDRSASILIERSSVPHEISKIVKYEIKDMLNLFKCDIYSRSLAINTDEDEFKKISEIGSMKGYWRKTIHTVEKKSKKRR